MNSLDVHRDGQGKLRVGALEMRSLYREVQTFLQRVFNLDDSGQAYRTLIAREMKERQRMGKSFQTTHPAGILIGLCIYFWSGDADVDALAQSKFPASTFGYFLMLAAEHQDIVSESGEKAFSKEDLVIALRSANKQFALSEWAQVRRSDEEDDDLNEGDLVYFDAKTWGRYVEAAQEHLQRRIGKCLIFGKSKVRQHRAAIVV